MNELSYPRRGKKKKEKKEKEGMRTLRIGIYEFQIGDTKGYKLMIQEISLTVKYSYGIEVLIEF